ncbi:MAG: peptidoglycan synthetase [Flavobacteriales bacterium]|nr:peptidoglycan synthetase [Flavobacteriales bacterium]|tara:strand:+ start:8655 stop:10010 length:1356 start_codon:yes stop_codon:yes gene_type:complete
MRIHLIAIGGSAMHNMAIALHKKGYKVTGSDDEIFEPSKGRLAHYGLLPEKMGWDESNVTTEIDVIILGMHARKDNPELLKGQALGLKIYSYPEYIYEQTKDKTRIVIGGSHGKTSITAMTLHVLQKAGKNVDYMVGAQLDGFDTMVKLTQDADYVVLEGDEYLSSPIDLRPKFHLYHPHIAVISGIAWDHINVFPTFENYVEQFQIFVNKIERNGTLIYYKDDSQIAKIGNSFSGRQMPYSSHPNKTINGTTFLVDDNKEYPLLIFGDHNLQNLNAALKICTSIGIPKSVFYTHIQTFKGASKRLELVAKNQSCNIYKDFAHSPSKLKATSNAVKKQFDQRKLIACMELHTFSSLNAEFLQEYANTMDCPDEAYVYFNPATIAHKKLDPISEVQVLNFFNRSDLKVFTDSKTLINELKSKSWLDTNLLFMSSGNFDGVDFDALAEELLQS